MPTEEDMLGKEATPQIRSIVRRAASCAGVDDELTENLADPNMEWIKRSARKDAGYQELLRKVRKGFPEDRNKLEESVRPYFQLRGELSEWQGLPVLRSSRIVIPVELRKEILQPPGKTEHKGELVKQFIGLELPPISLRLLHTVD